jgi:hypothetical protein
LSRSVKAYCKKMGRPIQADCSKPDKQLTADTMKKRLQFCKENRARNWGQVMFTDRCKFHFTYVGSSVKKCVWRRVGTRRTAYKVNHASCYNVYAGITKYGVTHMHVVAGTTNHTPKFTNKKGQAAKNITGAEYQHVVSTTFLPHGKQLFGGAGMSHWVLQQDNDPSHKKAAVAAIQQWNSKNPGNSVTLLPHWPPNSPDLNPIENVWAYVQAEVNKAGCSDFASFCATVERVFSNLGKQHLQRLFRNMKDRVEMCIKRNGDKTRY